MINGIQIGQDSKDVTHFTNDFAITIEIQYKFQFILI